MVFVRHESMLVRKCFLTLTGVTCISTKEVTVVPLNRELFTSKYGKKIKTELSHEFQIRPEI